MAFHFEHQGVFSLSKSPDKRGRVLPFLVIKSDLLND